MDQATKRAQCDEMWDDHENAEWMFLFTYYRKAYRGESWPEGAREEVLRLKHEAENKPGW